jgi:acyl carrier protein
MGLNRYRQYPTYLGGGIVSPVSFREAAAGSSSRPEIVHFDATIRRKEKMHHLAARDYPETAGGKREQTVHHQPVPRPSAVTGTGARKVPSAVSPPAASPAPSPKAAPVAAASAVRDPASAGHAKPQKPPAAAPVLEKSKPPAPEKPQINIAELESLLINFVVEQTGYPAEMVELDADLEADLGIDSIKKAQMLGELAEQLDLQISISEDMSLDDFPTLRHITDYLRNASSGADKASAAIPDAPAVAAGPLNGAHRNGDAHRNGVHAPRTSGHGETTVVNSPSRPIAEAAVPATSPVSTLNIDDLEKFLVNFVVEQTGYPPEMVELDADLEADLGIDSIKKAQLFGELAEQLNIQIQITEDLSLDSFPHSSSRSGRTEICICNTSVDYTSIDR